MCYYCEEKGWCPTCIIEILPLRHYGYDCICKQCDRDDCEYQYDCEAYVCTFCGDHNLWEEEDEESTQSAYSFC